MLFLQNAAAKVLIFLLTPNFFRTFAHQFSIYYVQTLFRTGSDSPWSGYSGGFAGTAPDVRQRAADGCAGLRRAGPGAASVVPEAREQVLTIVNC